MGLDASGGTRHFWIKLNHAFLYAINRRSRRFFFIQSSGLQVLASATLVFTIIVFGRIFMGRASSFAIRCSWCMRQWSPCGNEGRISARFYSGNLGPSLFTDAGSTELLGRRPSLLHLQELFWVRQEYAVECTAGWKKLPPEEWWTYLVGDPGWNWTGW